jgi:alkylated DNA repair dioxygenase AlkB
VYAPSEIVRLCSSFMVLVPGTGSASFGTPRDFVLRRNSDHSDKLTFRLGAGDVLVMKVYFRFAWVLCGAFTRSCMNDPGNGMPMSQRLSALLP